MDEKDLEKLGLNRNEARVYFGLLKKGQANASELVKTVGVHRNIVYDNLERLMEKGLVSFVNEGTKRKFIAEKPQAIIEFLESKQKDLDKKIEKAKEFMPKINEMLKEKKSKQDVSIFRGIAGMKKVLAEIVRVRRSWCGPTSRIWPDCMTTIWSTSVRIDMRWVMMIAVRSRTNSASRFTVAAHTYHFEHFGFGVYLKFHYLMQRPAWH